MSLKIVLQNVSADSNFVPPKLSLCNNSAKLLQRLNLGGTKFESADTFCRTIFKLMKKKIHWSLIQQDPIFVCLKFLKVLRKYQKI
ncbi:hypothetical protein BpHYR1_000584 [Brachionus plicatilis]|uniref:Uncharacterized protein n=1 Tax=Brachionus plicatilis TaxID=10195 RepID=A0A3M7RGC0_BRAPC|nr:hypothetical protein BpHYR1_000584 [Brachionus plicatilis]